MVYIENEQDLALNIANNKNWYEMSYKHFEKWAQRIDVHWAAIKTHLDETIQLARTKSPEQLKVLPMLDEHKIRLREHWPRLHKYFKIDS